MYQGHDGSIHLVETDGSKDRRLFPPPPSLVASGGAVNVLAWDLPYRVMLCEQQVPEYDESTKEPVAHEFYLVDMDTRETKPLQYRNHRWVWVSSEIMGDLRDVIVSPDGGMIELVAFGDEEYDPRVDPRTAKVDWDEYELAGDISSPDGRFTVTSDYVGKDYESMWLVDVLRNEKTQGSSIVDYKGEPLCFTPDGEQIVMLRAGENDEGFLGYGDEPPENYRPGRPNCAVDEIWVSTPYGTTQWRIAKGTAPILVRKGSIVSD